MKRKYEVVYSPQVQKFKADLSLKELKKINFVLDKVEIGLFGDWFKKMSGSEDLWEFVINYNGIFYRILAFFDKTDKEIPLIIAAIGFKKKSNKTPSGEIEKATQFKKRYFNEIC